MDLRPRSHIHHYFLPTTLSYRKLPTYVDTYKHYIWLKHMVIYQMILNTKIINNKR